MTTRMYGPNASLHLAMLDEKQQELFHWFTDKLTGDAQEALRFSSLLQAVACRIPNISYWAAISAVKLIAESPGFLAECTIQDAAALKVLRTPPES